MNEKHETVTLENEASRHSAKAGVFVAIYERGSAYQKEKTILEHPRSRNTSRTPRL